MVLDTVLIEYKLEKWWEESESVINEFVYECMGGSNFSEFVESIELDKNDVEFEDEGDSFRLRLIYVSEFSGLPDVLLDRAVDEAGGVTVSIKGNFDNLVIELFED